MYEVTIRRTEIAQPIFPCGWAEWVLPVAGWTATVTYALCFFASWLLSEPGEARWVWVAILILGPFAAAAATVVVATIGRYAAYGLQLFAGEFILRRRGWRLAASKVATYRWQPWKWHLGLFE